MSQKKPAGGADNPQFDIFPYNRELNLTICIIHGRHVSTDAVDFTTRSGMSLAVKNMSDIVM